MERHFPDRVSRIEGRIRDVRAGRLNDSEFGRRMSGTGEMAAQISQVYHVFARRHGLDGDLPPYNCSRFHPPPRPLRSRAALLISPAVTSQKDGFRHQRQKAAISVKAGGWNTISSDRARSCAVQCLTGGNGMRSSLNEAFTEWFLPTLRAAPREASTPDIEWHTFSIHGCQTTTLPVHPAGPPVWWLLGGACCRPTTRSRLALRVGWGAATCGITHEGTNA